MRRFIRKRRPSASMTVAVVSLVFALAGTATAVTAVTALTKKEKKQTRNIAKQEINKKAPGLSVDNANKLGTKLPSAFETGAASDSRTDTNALGTGNETVLSASISTPAAKTVTAFASVEALSDGGTNDNINCNLSIDGVDGGRQSTYVTPNTLEDSTTLPLTQAASVAAGTHTVIVECNEGGVSGTSVEERALSVVTTG